LSYSQTYYVQPTNPVDAYDPSCCIPAEFGRVRSVAFIRKGYLQQILSNATDLIVWQNGITNGNIVILPLTRGSFDAGNPKKYKGYGRRLSTHGYREMQLDFLVPAFKWNADFFNDLNYRLDFVPAFRTSSWLHICNASADITTTVKVEDDLESAVIWSASCLIKAKDLPINVDLSTLIGLFACIPNGDEACLMNIFSETFSCVFQ
jgi:hypothetical protein